MKSANLKKDIYLPHDECRLITALYELAVNGVHYCVYKKYFDGLSDKFDSKSHLWVWYQYTLNAYFDLAIGNWCKLFGAYSEPTHYSHLLVTDVLKSKLIEIGVNPAEKNQLKSRLLSYSNLSEEKYDMYHQLTKDYRDRNLIHREHSPDKINDGDLDYPKLEMANETFLALVLILVEISRRSPSVQDSLNLYRFTYHDVSNKEQICNLIEQSTPVFIAKLNLSKIPE